MNSLSKREKVLLILAVAVIISYIYYFKYLSFFNEKIKEMNSSINIYKTQINEIHNYDGSISKNLQVNLSSMQNTLPFEEKNENIINNIKLACEKNKVALQGLEFKEPYENNSDYTKKLYTVPVNLSISGNYYDITNFITTLEDSERITNIYKLQIDKSENQYNAEINMYYYYFNNGLKDDDFSDNLDGISGES